MKTVLTSLVTLTCTAQPTLAEDFSGSRVLPDAVSTAKNEYNFQVSGDLQIFARAEVDFSLGKIMLSRRVAGDWVAPERIPFSDERFKDSDPWLSPDSRTIYFISDRPVHAGEVKDADDYDVWRTRRVGGAWIAPERLDTINSHAAEFGPEVHGDSLYFSSTRTGEYDIYRARLLNGQVSNPTPHPAPINSEAADSDFTLSPDGRVAVWCSTRPGGAGRCDLYTSRIGKDGWTAATNLGPRVNTEGSEFTPSLSPNGARLYFASSRGVAGQEEGASDIYEIAVSKVPVLQKAMSEAALERLRIAFGGENVHSIVNTLSFTLERRSPGAPPVREDYLYDFAREAIMRRETTGQSAQTVYVRGNEGVRIENGLSSPLDASERAVLRRGLHLNFLYFLRHPEVELTGPFDITGHGDLAWYKLSVNEVTSPLLGLDPRTGRIVKVGSDPQVQVLETDYMPTADGLIFPHRYMVIDRGAVVKEGRYSDVRTSVPFPQDAPQWIKN